MANGKKYDPTKKSGRLRPQSKTTLKQRMSKVDALFDKKNNWKKLNPKIRSKIRKAKYDKLSPKQKKQLASFKTIGEATMFIGGLTPVGRAVKVTGGVAKTGSKIIPKLTAAYKKWRKTTDKVTKKRLKKIDKPTKITPPPKPKLTKEQMVRTISDKSRPRLPKGEIPKPPSGNLPVVRTSSKQVPSSRKQVPALRKKTEVTSQQTPKMRLSGLNAAKKQKLEKMIGGPNKLRNYIIGGGVLTAAAITAYLLRDKKILKKSPKAAASKQDFSIPHGSGEPGTGGKPSKKIDFTAGDKIRKERKIPKMDDGQKYNPDDVLGRNKAFQAWAKNNKSKLTGMNENFFEKGLAKIGGGKIRSNLRSSLDGFYSHLMDKRNSLEGLTESEESFVKNTRKKGGKVVKKKKKKKQRYKSRKDESIAMRVKKKRTKKQLKSSRNESYGKWGKGKGKGKVNKVFRRGGGKALRGFGKATYSNKLY